MGRLKQDGVTVSVVEAAELMGVDPETIRDQMRRKVFPVGYAVQRGTGRGWSYHIPKEPILVYMRTGKFPE